MPEFEGKVAVVTGSGSGIGEAVAKTLAGRGARVVVADLVEQAAERVSDEIREAGGEAASLLTDVSDADDAERLVQFAVATYGRLDLAFNNAGVNHAPARLHELSVAEFDRVYGVNGRGVALCLRAELAYMVEHGGGRIVNTASGSGLSATPMQPAYTMSKHAVVGLTRAAGTDYAALGIRVNAIAPGLVETPMTAPLTGEVRAAIVATTPQGRMGTTREIAETVAFLLGDGASYVNGAVLSVDGGLTAHN